MTASVLCARCQASVRGRSPADRQPLCRREPVGGWPGLVWLAALCGVGVDDVMEAVTWN